MGHSTNDGDVSDRACHRGPEANADVGEPIGTATAAAAASDADAIAATAAATPTTAGAVCSIPATSAASTAATHATAHATADAAAATGRWPSSMVSSSRVWRPLEQLQLCSDGDHGQWRTTAAVEIRSSSPTTTRLESKIARSWKQPLISKRRTLNLRIRNILCRP